MMKPSLFSDSSLPDSSKEFSAASENSSQTSSNSDPISDLSVASNSNNSISAVMANALFAQELLRVIPLIRRVIRRNLNSRQRQAAEDIEQRVLLNLWQWRIRNSERSFSSLELEKIAARAAQRGVLLFYRENMRNKFSLIDYEDAANSLRDSYRNDRNSISEVIDHTVFFMGSTKTEVASLARFLYQEIQKLSLRGRYALLLQKSDLIVHLLISKGCSIAEIAGILQLSRNEFLNVLRSLPLSDEQIGELGERQMGERLTAKQVWEARCRARLRIKKALERLQIINDRGT